MVRLVMVLRVTDQPSKTEVKVKESTALALLPKVDLRDWLENRAIAAEDKRDFRLAIRYWSNLLQRLTRSGYAQGIDVTELAAIHYRLGLAHRSLRDSAKSIYHLKYSIRLNSEEPRYYEAFGKAFVSGGHWRVAKAQFDKALRLDPLNATYLRQYSWVLLMMGRKFEALRYAEKAVKREPEVDENHWHLSKVYAEVGRLIESSEILDRLIERNPLSTDYSAAKKDIEQRFKETFEGHVLELSKWAMRSVEGPVDLQTRKIQKTLWRSFCKKETVAESICPYPQAWTAALWILSSFLQKLEPNFERIGELLQIHLSEVWPCMKRLEEELRLKFD